MKKIMCTVLIVLMVISGFTVGFAAEIENEEISPLAGGSAKITVPTYQQPKNSDLCGPTCCRMILAAFGTYKELNAIKNEMANMADKDYTHIDSVTTMLNRYISGNHYVKSSLTSVANSFSNYLMDSIDAGYPVVCQLDTRYLPVYNGESYTHYVVSTGYLWGQGGSSGGTNIVYYNDPHYNDAYAKEKTCTFTDMQNAINAYYGLIVRGA